MNPQYDTGYYASNSDGAFEDLSGFSEEHKPIEPPKKEIKWYKKRWAINMFLFFFGIAMTVGGQALFYEVGLISLPVSDETLSAPKCYACVNLAPLDGKYASLMDVKVTGLEVKVKTTQVYHGDTGLVDTIVDVKQDPTGQFTACECDSVPYHLSPVNCSIGYAYDKCTDDCDSANGIDEQFTLYDPKLDQIESNIVVSVLGQQIHQVAIFKRVHGDDDN